MPIKMSVTSTFFDPSFSSSFSPLFSLVYVSASSHLMDDEGLDAILVTSRANNTDLGLTGMLLYYEGAFMQVLEGTEENVRRIYARISQDPRHQRLTPLLEEYIPERAFPEWSMGYHRICADEAQRLEGFAPFAEADHFIEYFQGMPQRSLILLQSFRDTARH